MSTDPWFAGRRPSIHPTGTADFLAGLNDQPWASQALCAQTDPEAFFPDKGGSTREAKATCATCDVRDQCLTYALEHDEPFGIWGGLSERERRRLKKSPAARPRPCGRAGCAETIPVTAHAQMKYHDPACRRLATDTLVAAGLDHQPILREYLNDNVPIGRVAAHHRVQISVITLILDQHGIDHSRAAARRRAAAQDGAA